jgi:hypothetical protein
MPSVVSTQDLASRFFRDLVVGVGPSGGAILFVSCYLLRVTNLGILLSVLYLIFWKLETRFREKTRQEAKLYNDKAFDELLKETFAEDCCGL